MWKEITGTELKQNGRSTERKNNTLIANKLNLSLKLTSTIIAKKTKQSSLCIRI